MRNTSSAVLLAALTGLVFCPAAQAQVTEFSWSGYLLKSSNLTTSQPATTFSAAGAHWVQPAVYCNGSNGRVSFWVGLDGGAPGSSTVEQAGTFVRCTPGQAKPTYTAFWEMFSPRNNSSGGQPFDVSPGDAIEALVTYANGLFTLGVNDITRHHVLSKSIACTDNPICKRGTAEWIVEKPGGGYPLADYGSVFFDDVSATSVGAYPQEEVIAMLPKGTKQVLSSCNAAPRPPLPRETEVATVDHPHIDLYDSFQCQWSAP